MHILATFLICDGRQNDAVLEMMSQEGCLSRLIELIGEKRDGDADGLHRLLLVLFYEMARIQQLDANDLCTHALCSVFITNGSHDSR